MENATSAVRVDPVYLADLLQRVLGNSSVQIGEWGVQRITGGLDYTSAIYRLQGSVMGDGTEQSWSLILKVIRPDPKFDDPREYRYWKREMLPELLAEETRLRWVENVGGPPERAGESDAKTVAYYQSIAMEVLKLLGLRSILRVLGRTAYYALRLAGKRRAGHSKTTESRV